MKAIKKPIEVEVWQIPAVRIDGSTLPEWVADAFDDRKIVMIGAERDEYDCADVETLEGNMTAKIGDYIIKGIKGEIYPIRKDIFEETYEVVND